MNGLKKEKETFISDLIEEFEKVSLVLEEKYNVSIQLVRILGNRWSYLAGKKIDNFPLKPPQCIKLNNKLGLVVYSKDVVLDAEQIRNAFKKLTGKIKWD